MKVVAVVGSPRHGGNSDILVDRIIRGAESAGAQVHRFFLNDLNIRPCQACEGCRKYIDDPCVLDDDMQQIHEHLREADALIIGTPIYWFSPSAQTKIFLDRLYCFGGPEGYHWTARRVAIAMTYADADALVSGALNAYRIFQDSFRWVGATTLTFVHGSAWHKGDIANVPGLLEHAEAVGRQMCEQG